MVLETPLGCSYGACRVAFLVHFLLPLGPSGLVSPLDCVHSHPTSAVRYSRPVKLQCSLALLVVSPSKFFAFAVLFLHIVELPFVLFALMIFFHLVFGALRFLVPYSTLSMVPRSLLYVLGYSRPY